MNKVNINLQVKTLREAISKLNGVVDKKNTRPVLTNYFFEVSNNLLTISATDLEVSAKIFVPCECNDQIKICINSKSLFDILRELPEGELILEYSQENSLIGIRCGTIFFNLVTTSPEDFPHINISIKEDNFPITSEELHKIIQKTAHAISNDETRYNLNGIFIQDFESRLRAVATDGHVLALTENNQNALKNTILKNGVIIPKKGVFELKKLTEAYPDANLRISVDESFLNVGVEDKFFLSIRLIAREYPRYQPVIPNKTTFGVLIDKNQLVTAVKRIKILANEKSNAVKFSMKPGKLLISAHHPTLGKAEEEIEIDYDGKELEIGFNAKYLMDTFTVIEDDNVKLEFNNEFSPVVIRSSKEDDFMGIVMPLRL